MSLGRVGDVESYWPDVSRSLLSEISSASLESTTGRVEVPFLFKSQVFTNTLREDWVYVPAQYPADKPHGFWRLSGRLRAIH